MQSDDGQLPVDEEDPNADPLSVPEEKDDDPTVPPSVKGEGSASGTSPDPDSDDDVGEMMKEVTGKEPENGETLAQQMEEAERLRRGMPPKEEEQEEEK